MYLVRVLRGMTRELRDVARGRTATHGRLRDSLTAIALATVGVDVICAVLAFVSEHHAKQTEVSSIGSAVFWTTTQLLTVSSQLKNPITTPARILDVAMEVYAITVIAGLAGAVGAFVVKRGQEIEHAATQPGHARRR